MVATRTLAERIADECLGFRTRLLNRVVTRLFDEALREHDLKIGQLTILVALALHPGVRPGRLADGLELEKSTLSRNLARMAERGWIATGDGLSLTPSGETLLREAYPTWRRAQKAVAGRLGEDGASALAGLAADLGV